MMKKIKSNEVEQLQETTISNESTLKVKVNKFLTITTDIIPEEARDVEYCHLYLVKKRNSLIVSFTDSKDNAVKVRKNRAGISVPLELFFSKKGVTAEAIKGTYPAERIEFEGVENQKFNLEVKMPTEVKTLEEVKV